jgi:hypothetical protein
MSARVSAIVLVLVVGGVAGLAGAGRPAPLPPVPTPPVHPVQIQKAEAAPTQAPATPAVPTPTHRLILDDARFQLPGFFTAPPTPTTEPARYVFNWLGRHWLGPGQKLTR